MVQNQGLRKVIQSRGLIDPLFQRMPDSQLARAQLPGTELTRPEACSEDLPGGARLLSRIWELGEHWAVNQRRDQRPLAANQQAANHQRCRVFPGGEAATPRARTEAGRADAQTPCCDRSGVCHVGPGAVGNPTMCDAPVEASLPHLLRVLQMVSNVNTPSAHSRNRSHKVTTLQWPNRVAPTSACHHSSARC